MAARTVSVIETLAAPDTQSDAQTNGKQDALTIAELMQAKRAIDEELKKDEQKLAAVKKGDTSELKLEKAENNVTLSMSDSAALDAMVKKMNPGKDAAGNERTGVSAIRGNDHEAELQAKLAHLKELFPGRDIQGLLVKDETGKDMIAYVGVSASEANAAMKLERETQAIKLKAEMLQKQIEEKAKAPSASLTTAETPRMMTGDEITRAAEAFNTTKKAENTLPAKENPRLTTSDEITRATEMLMKARGDKPLPQREGVIAPSALGAPAQQVERGKIILA